jgi:redox-sensitive bicupin YhaK (pirin superfamily)
MTLQMHIRRSADRGHADHGWLDTRHSFSFANYYDPRFMGFSHLRVINQDVVAPGRGFGAHPHRNMEIISYVLRGGLEHRDTLGTGSVIRPGEVQLMSAGRGIAHSEFNASKADPVEFLQIWILPREAGGQPRYAQAAFDLAETGLRLVVSPDGRDGSLTIGQDMDLYRLLLPEGGTAAHTLQRKRAWVQLIRGELVVNGAGLFPGDGLAVEAADTLQLVGTGDVEALVFDLL